VTINDPSQNLISAQFYVAGAFNDSGLINHFEGQHRRKLIELEAMHRVY
jgi:hypothetical protein